MARAARLFLIAGFLIGFTPPVSAGTVLADLVDDFVPGVDPGDVVMPPASGTGSWRYLASATLNPTDPGAALADLEWDSVGQLFERPAENHTDGFSNDVITIAGSELTMHPAEPEDFVVARWIAGAGEAGLVDIIGHVRKGDEGGGDGIRFVVFVNGVSVFDQNVAFDDTVGIPFLLPNVDISEGSTTDFVVSKISSPFFDTTRVTATITPAPEPSHLLLCALGAPILAAARKVRGAAWRASARRP